MGTQDRPSVGRGIPLKFATTMANQRARGKYRQKQLEIQGPSADMTGHIAVDPSGFTKDWALIELFY